MKIVIRAGGVGTRLWPKSREVKPKQFQELLGSKTMVQETWRRARKLAPASKIYFSTNITLGKLARKQLPELLPQNLILEPERKDSGPAVALESVILTQDDPSETVIGFPADHFIGKEDEFVKIVKHGEKILEKYPDHILCIGIRPRFAATGFGYIKMGKQMETMSGLEFFAVNAFKEKPDLATAKKFYKDWHYLWNANYFMWKPGVVLDLIQQFAPQMYDQVMELAPSVGKKSFASHVAKVFPKLEKVAFEYIIIEPNKKLLVVPADIDWSDIGDWKEIAKIGNHKLEGNHVGMEDDNILVQVPKGKLVATLGLKNVAIIDTGDALLVCSLEHSPDVKKVVEKLKEDKQLKKYL